MSENKAPKFKVQRGEYPFPLTGGPEESRFLTWLRNHSNYMAIRGLLDYLRSIAVLVRGIIVNFLIFLPFLLFISIGLGATHHWMLDHPYRLTICVLLLAVGWVLLFPVAMPLLKIFNFQKTLRTGSESTIKQRDIYQRTFGGVLLAIVAVACLESMPWALENLHDLTHKEHLDWTRMVAILTGALVFLSGSDKLLSALSGAKKKVAMVLIGLLGLIVPLLVIMVVTDFLVYGNPPRPSVILSPLSIPVIGALGLIIAIPLGLTRRAFTKKECFNIVGMLIGALFLVAFVITICSRTTSENSKSTEQSLEKIINPLNQVCAQFTNIPPDTAMDPEVKDLVSQVVSVQRKYARTMADISASQNSAPPVSEEPKTPSKDGEGLEEAQTRSSAKEETFKWWDLKMWRQLEERAKLQRAQFESGQQFITLGNEFSALPPGSLDSLRDEIADLAHDQLLMKLERESTTDSEQLPDLLRETLDEAVIKEAVRRLVKMPSSYVVAKGPSSDTEAAIANATPDGASNPSIEISKPEDKVLKRLKALRISNSDVISESAIVAEQLLQNRTVEELAKIAGTVNLEKLLQRKGEKKDAIASLWERKKELAELTGMPALAEFVTKEEIIAELLSDLRFVSSGYQRMRKIDELEREIAELTDPKRALEKLNEEKLRFGALDDQMLEEEKAKFEDLEELENENLLTELDKEIAKLVENTTVNLTKEITALEEETKEKLEAAKETREKAALLEKVGKKTKEAEAEIDKALDKLKELHKHTDQLLEDALGDLKLKYVFQEPTYFQKLDVENLAIKGLNLEKLIEDQKALERAFAFESAILPLDGKFVEKLKRETDAIDEQALEELKENTDALKKEAFENLKLQRKLLTVNALAKVSLESGEGKKRQKQIETELAELKKQRETEKEDWEKKIAQFEKSARKEIVKFALPGQTWPLDQQDELAPGDRTDVARDLVSLAGNDGLGNSEVTLSARAAKWKEKRDLQYFQLDQAMKEQHEKWDAELQEFEKLEEDNPRLIQLKAKVSQLKVEEKNSREEEAEILFLEDERRKRIEEKAREIENRKKALNEFITQERESLGKMIRLVAAEELANLVFGEFDSKILAVIAVRPDLYEKQFDELVGDRDIREFLFEDVDKELFETNRKIDTLAEEATLKKLVKVAFDESTASDEVHDLFSEEELKATDGHSLPNVVKLLLAEGAVSKLLIAENAPEEGIHSLLRSRLAQLARRKLVEKALGTRDLLKAEESGDAREKLEYVYGRMGRSFSANLGRGADRSPSNGDSVVDPFSSQELAKIAISKFLFPSSDLPDQLVSTLMFGKYGPLDRSSLRTVNAKLSRSVMRPKIIFISLLTIVLLIGTWYTIDVNMTSIHGLYRDRLASAFLVGRDTRGDVDIEDDIDLEEICRYEARSIAPYHLVNVALNLQSSDDPGIRDRNSDFFIYSKRFIGGARTGYCRSETMEQVFPQMSLATAMAVSAGAASPNMGRGTSPLMVAFMTLLNIRLGFWMPNPGLLEEKQNKEQWRRRVEAAKLPKQQGRRKSDVHPVEPPVEPLGFTFAEVFATELEELKRRWDRIDPAGTERQRDNVASEPTVDLGLVGAGFSGGGIRSAAINLGITQVLQRSGIFKHIDYMSTVSGGGYLGSSISALMRSRESLESEIAGTVTVEKEHFLAEFDGRVKLSKDDTGDQLVVVTFGRSKEKVHRFSPDARIIVKHGQRVKQGDSLIEHPAVIVEKAPPTPELTNPAEGQEGDSTDEPEEPKEEKFKQITGDQVVIVTASGSGEKRSYWFSGNAVLNVRNKENISANKVLLKPRSAESLSEISGTVSVERTSEKQIVKVQGLHGEDPCVYEFSKFERLLVATGDAVTANDTLIERQNTLGKQFRWRVRPTAFLREMSSRLDEKHDWVNLSDGGHIENLAAIELLRRRCKFMIIGDGECDPKLHFQGLATLIRTARIDLGVEIDINLDKIRLKEDDKSAVSERQWAMGTINYPEKGETGKLLYLKSSFTGKEDEVIQEYRRRNPAFPHESTADQSFDEGQFEAYRALGQHIAEQAFTSLGAKLDTRETSYQDLHDLFVPPPAQKETSKKKTKQE